MSHRIVVLDPIAPLTAERMTALLPPGFTLDYARERGEDAMRALIADADFAISGQVPVSRAVLAAGTRLKLLHKWGVGTDNLDLDAARELGIKVARTTGSNAVPVAEFTIGLILATLRHLAYAHAELREGRWRGGRLPSNTYMLSKKTVGIVGFGAIGRTVARLLQGFGCNLLYTMPRRLSPADEAAAGVTYADLPALLTQSDVVCLHCPLTEATRGMIGRAALSTMKNTAILVNVARGGIVVEADLLWALQNGVIHGAATDVFETEPVPPDNPLLSLPNMVVTPHIAAGAADNFANTINQMFRNIAAVASGEPVAPADRVVD
jgi:phosphoglycerate dehydrogenase-like enzyme